MMCKRCKEAILKKYKKCCKDCRKKLVTKNITYTPYTTCSPKTITVERMNLHIHHKNGNDKDNRWSNLVLLCSSCHRKRHYKSKK